MTFLGHIYISEIISRQLYWGITLAKHPQHSQTCTGKAWHYTKSNNTFSPASETTIIKIYLLLKDPSIL